MPDQILDAKPMVLIGLGGTGKQTLLNLRRRFFEHYGVRTLPHIAMVVIDTDERLQHLDGTEYNEFDAEVQLTESEFVRVPIGAALENFQRNRRLAPHIDSWLDPALDAYGRIEDQAAQVRAFGRFAFFSHLQEITHALHEAYARVTSREAVDAALNTFSLRIDNRNVSTRLIFSVAGGTGSGMFLDVAFLARQEARAYTEALPEAIILLPTAFQDDLPSHVSDHHEYRRLANSYAALAELDSYNFPLKFRIQWTQEQFLQQPPHYESGPVFANTWLIDNEAREGAGRIKGGSMPLCQMIAEWLFVQNCRSTALLGGHMAARHAIITQEAGARAKIVLAETDGVDEPFEQQFNNRYSSFGLSKIYIPTDSLADQAYARLVADFAREWRADSAKGDVRADLMRRLYTKIHLPPGGQVRGFTDLLGRRLSIDDKTQPLARRFERLISLEHDKLKDRGFESGAEAEARDWFSSAVLNDQLNGASASVARRGEISRIVQVDNEKAALTEIQKALDDFVAESLMTPGERLAFAENALRHILGDFQKASSEANDRATVEQRRGERLGKEVTTLLSWCSSHRGFDRRTLFEAAFTKMKEQATAELRRQVYLSTAKVATDAAAHIGLGRTVKDTSGRETVVDTGLLSSLHAVRGVLEALERRANERINALRAQATSPLNLRAPAAELDARDDQYAELNAIYKTDRGDPIGPGQLHEFEPKLYESLAHVGLTSPWVLRLATDPGTQRQRFEQMMDFARSQLSHLPQRLEDAIAGLDRLYQNNDAQGRFDVEVGNTFRRGSPWFPPYTHYSGHNEGYKSKAHHTFVAASDRAAWGPKERMLKAIGFTVETVNAARVDGGPNKELIEGPLDSVYFESELLGVPLFAIRHLDLYRNAYLGHIDASDAMRRVVHNERDTEKFNEIFVLSAEEYRLRQAAIGAFAKGLVCGVLDGSPGRYPGTIEWRFTEVSRAAPRPVLHELGRYTTAIRLLSRPQSPKLGALAREIDKRFAERVTQDDLGRIYAALDRLKIDSPIEDSEWSKGVAAVEREMRDRHGQAIVDQATEAEKTFASWADTSLQGVEHPFVRLKALTTLAQPG